MVVHNLGRVIDKDKGIYKNRKSGYISYNLESDQLIVLDEDTISDFIHSPLQEQDIIDFGDSFFLDSLIHNDGLDKPLNVIHCHNQDSLYAMVAFYVLNQESNLHAKDWFEHSYARYLYPSANASSQRISELLIQIGTEDSYRAFFTEYFKYLEKIGVNCRKIIVDSTGLPNSVHFPLTAVSNHNGKISNEVRFILVTEEDWGIPVFMRYIPGNIIDISTLATTVKELNQYDIKPCLALMDAGYFSEANIDYLMDHSVDFVCRVQPNRLIYKRAIKAQLDDLETEDHMVWVGNRFVFITHYQTDLTPKHRGWVYLCKDILQKSKADEKLDKEQTKKKRSKHEAFDLYEHDGLFVMVASTELSNEELLPAYYIRQQVEQTFDISKNDEELIPLRIQSEEAMRGHLLLSFIATAINKRIHQKLITSKTNKDKTLTPEAVLQNLRYQHAKVFIHEILPQEPNAKANLGYRLFGIKSPLSIPRET